MKKKSASKSKATVSSFVSRIKLNRKTALLFIVIFTGIGSALLIISHAATPTASIETENASITSPAIFGTDSNASGGGYVQFKAVSGRSVAWRTLGVFPGYGDASGATSFVNFESFLGRQLSFADANMGAQNWSDFGGTAWGQFTNAYGAGVSAGQGMFYTMQRVIPAITVGISVRSDSGYTPSNSSAMYAATAARFQEVISGTDDGYYRDLAQKMADSGHSNGIIRLGHESDIDFYPWSMVGGNQNLYKQAFQHVHDVFKSVSSNFKFDYQGDGNWFQPNPSDGNTKYGDSGYPGDAYVDYIGCDPYDGGGGWTAAKAELDYTEDLAKRHGKQMSIPEWGLFASGYAGGHGDDPTFIQNMYDWINAQPASGPGSIAYHTYFNGEPHSNLDQFPNAKAKFKQLFGN